MSVASESTGVAGYTTRLRQLTGWILSDHAMLVAAILLFLAFALTSPVFGTLGNAENIARQTASVLVLGLGMSLVVLVGGIDLSVGSVVLLSATVAGIGLTEDLHPLVALIVAVGAGALVGLLNALLIEALRISPVIVTLGTMIAIRGLALALLGEYRSWIDISAPIFNDLAIRRIGGVPLDAIVALGAALLLWVVLSRTLVGRRLYAVGDNATAARLCGLRVLALRGFAYVACGALAGFGGVMTASRTGVVSPSIGVGLEFFAIAIVALGAGGLPSGRIRIGQTVVGALILMMVFNYMTIRGVPGTWQTTTTGLLLLVAMVTGRLIQGRSEGGETVGEAFVDASGRLGIALSRNAMVIATIALAIVFAVVNPRFASLANAITLVEQNAALAIVAVGATLGILSRSVDISPGSVVALGAVAAALSFQAGAPPALALAAGVFACLALYGFNGLIVGGLGLDPLIVTLAAWIWARGLAVSLTGAATLPFDQGFVAFMNTPAIFGFTPAVVLVAGAFLAGWIILTRMPIGMRIYALGNDARMLRQSGADDRKVRVVTLLLMGSFTAAGMLVMLGRFGAAAPTAGFGLELDAIVAVVIGGASFRGGEGRLRDTAIGVLFLAVLNNGLSGLQMGDAQFFMIKGGAILAALTLRAGARLLPAAKARAS
jgi:ribose/xylose/arabinose/galactoside ABC-type transport system permease subunit